MMLEAVSVQLRQYCVGGRVSALLDTVVTDSDFAVPGKTREARLISGFLSESAPGKDFLSFRPIFPPE